MLEIKNSVLVVVLILKHTGLYGIQIIQIQIIFTYGNQYCAQIFVRLKCHLHACYIHGHNHAHNLWRPECMIFLIFFKTKVCTCSFGKKKKTVQSFSFQKRMFLLSSCFSNSTRDLIWLNSEFTSIYTVTTKVMFPIFFICLYSLNFQGSVFTEISFQ